MLKVNNFIFVIDNSGILKLKILKFYKKTNKTKSFLKVSDIFMGILYETNIHKRSKLKLKKKTKIMAIVTTTKKKYSKKNGIFINFSENTCVPIKITRFITPYASYITGPCFTELRYTKKFRIIIKRT